MTRKTQSKRNQEQLELLKKDFVAFLFVVWAALGLPKPTKCQIDMARTLADGSRKKFILQAFRGIGKSFITCAYVVWLLWNNPQLKILIVSASKDRADNNSIFIKSIINLLPFLHSLKPEAGQRDSVVSFDVGGATPDASPSVKSVGITGQLTGSRADVIIADDVEVVSNSSTQGARDKLWTLVQEFAALLKPLDSSRVIYLGTPQTEMTLYKELEDNRGYETIIYPALYPRTREEELFYGERIAKMLRDEYNENPEALRGEPTDPVRFDKEELRIRELEYGKAGFTLQFMLNPNLSDAEKFPLRLRDLIVAELDPETSPLTYQWLPNPSNLLNDVPNIGIKGDTYHTYHSCSNHTDGYQRKILVIDPSGRGADESGWCVLYTLNGYIFLMDNGGAKDGYADATLEFYAKKAKEWKVDTVVFESNFGDGMFGKVLQPVLLKHHQCALEEYRSKGMKEVRICDTLEPIMGAHKLVVSKMCIDNDYKTARDGDGKHNVRFSLFYQMSRITRDRGALAKDDRIDALSIGCDYLKEIAKIDAEKNQEGLIEDWLYEQMNNDNTIQVVYSTYSSGVNIRYNNDNNNLGSWL